jgi:hypothetical protein
VVVFNFHVDGLAIDPRKNDSVLPVDPNAPPASTLPLKRFEPVAGRNAKIRGSCRCVDTVHQFARFVMKIMRESPPRRGRSIPIEDIEGTLMADFHGFKAAQRS